MRFRTFLIAIAPIAFFMPVSAARGQTPGAATTPDLKLEDAIRNIEEGDVENAKRVLFEVSRLAVKPEKFNLAMGLLYMKNQSTVPEAVNILQAYNKTVEGGQEYRGQAALGRLYMDSKMFSVATSCLLAAKRVAPPGMVNGKNVRADILLDLAECYHAQKKPRQALEEAKEAEKLAGGDPQIQLKLGEVALDAADLEVSMKAVDTAINLFKNKISLEPLNKKNYEALLAAHILKIRVGILLASAKPHEAKPTFDVAVATREGAEVKRLIGLIESRDMVLKALKSEQKDAALLITMKLFVAREEIELRAFQDADERIAEVLRTDPSNREALELRGKIAGGTAAASNSPAAP